MSSKPSPGRLRMRAERQARRALDPVVQAKAAAHKAARVKEKMGA